MHSVVITQRSGEDPKLTCAICGAEEDLLRYSEGATTNYQIRGLHGHTLRISGEGEVTETFHKMIVCKDCGALLEMPSWMDTEASET